MEPNAIMSVRITFDDGALYDLYQVNLNERGKITHIWPEIFATVDSMNDLDVIADRLRACRERGAVEPETLGDFFI